MNDLLSVARRLLAYADELDIGDRKHEDLRLAADVLRSMNIMLSAKAGDSDQTSGRSFQ